MDISIQLAWVLSVLLLSLRVGVFFFNTPFDAMGYVPTQVKLFVVLGLSAVLVTGLNIHVKAVPVSGWQYAIAAANELIIGLAMALGVHGLFAALNVAGRILDFQSGFGAANLFNPATNNMDPLIGTVLVLAGAVWFFLSDTYILVIRALSVSFEVWPPGGSILAVDWRAPVYIASFVFSYGILVAAPVLVVLYLIDTSVAVMARTMPQINVYFLFLPLKICLTLVLSGASLRYLSPVLEHMARNMDGYWLKLMS